MGIRHLVLFIPATFLLDISRGNDLICAATRSLSHGIRGSVFSGARASIPMTFLTGKLPLLPATWRAFWKWRENVAAPVLVGLRVNIATEKTSE
jgi:hypothetical protein